MEWERGEVDPRPGHGHPEDRRPARPPRGAAGGRGHGRHGRGAAVQPTEDAAAARTRRRPGRRLSEGAPTPPRRGGPQIIPRPAAEPARAGCPLEPVRTPPARRRSPSPMCGAALAAPRCRHRRRGRSEVPTVDVCPGPPRRPAAVLCALFDEAAGGAASPRGADPALVAGCAPTPTRCPFPGGRIEPAKRRSTPPCARPGRRSGWSRPRSTLLGELAQLCTFANPAPITPVRRRAARPAGRCTPTRPRWSGPSRCPRRADRPRRLPRGAVDLRRTARSDRSTSSSWSATPSGGRRRACCGSCWTWSSSAPIDRRRGRDGRYRDRRAASRYRGEAMICPRCGTVAAGQSASLHPMRRPAGSRRVGVARADPPVPRAPTHRGELAQRAAGIVPQVLARPQKPRAASPLPAPMRGDPRGPHRDRNRAAPIQPPRRVRPGRRRPRSGSRARSRAQRRPPEPAGPTGRLGSRRRRCRSRRARPGG